MFLVAIASVVFGIACFGTLCVVASASVRAKAEADRQIAFWQQQSATYESCWRTAMVAAQKASEGLDQLTRDFEQEHSVSGATYQITPQTPYDDLPELLTPSEYRTFTRLSRATTYAQIREKKIPAIFFGRLIRIPKTAVKPSGVR